MEQTSLNLLMRDGGLTITFRPGLTPDEYAALTTIATSANTKAELTAVLEKKAKEWGKQVMVDPCA